MNVHDNRIKIFIILASLGGLLGFCTGFSLLSAFELVYWFTVRIMNDYLDKNKIFAKTNQNKEETDKNEKVDMNTRMEKLESKMDEKDRRETKMLEKLKDIENLLKKKI